MNRDRMAREQGSSGVCRSTRSASAPGPAPCSATAGRRSRTYRSSWSAERAPADGPYDRAATYDAILARNPSARFIVPPCKGSVCGPTATISPTQRDLHVLAVDEHGRMNWQKASGCNTRSKVKASISCYKRVIGDILKSRHDTRRATEVAIAIKSLQPAEPTRACDIHSYSKIEAASTSRHASQSLHATRSPQADA